VDVFERLKGSCVEDWARFVDHSFVDQLALGTLPEANFRTYLVQDYLFLVQFARAHALAIFKSRSLADMRTALRGLAAILEVEMDLHVGLCAAWGISAAELEATPEHNATIAYTRFVLDCGMAGDLLDLHVALAPCVIGYADIAKSIVAAHGEPRPEHPYGRWIAEYAGDAYQAVAQAAREQLADLAGRSMTEQRFPELCSLFAKASRLEADFWQMALDAD
jgi:thiaminase/transcriptional activator TenA